MSDARKSARVRKGVTILRKSASGHLSSLYEETKNATSKDLDAFVARQSIAANNSGKRVHKDAIARTARVVRNIKSKAPKKTVTSTATNTTKETKES